MRKWMPWVPMLVAATFIHSAAAASAGRPNVLLIIADDLNDFVGPLRRFAPNLTPNMDRLAARGVNFRNAHANGLYCAPSRTSMMSGLYPTTTGYYGAPNNASGHRRSNPVLKDAVTLPEMFLNNGYATFLTGKIYHINAHAEFELYQGDTGGEDGRGIGADFGPWPWNGIEGKGYIPPNVHPSSLPPFNELPYNGYSRLSDIPEYAPDPVNGMPGFGGWSRQRKPWRYVNDEDRDLMPDEQSVLWASRIFQRERDRPFFMAFGFNRPHTPLYVPDKYFDLFPLDDIELPPMPPDDLDDVPEEGRQLDDKMAQIYKTFVEHAGEQGLKEFLQAYLASIRFVDDQLGILLQALDESPSAENTLIILTSDHGYHVGEKSRIGKKTCWERSTHIPLILAGAGIDVQGVDVDRPVSMVDIYPTLLELCSLQGHPNEKADAPPLDGSSLVPFLTQDPKDEWKGASAALSATDLSRTVRSERYRYILHNGGGEELYDMQADPNEFKNLASQPASASVKKNLRHQLERIGARKHDE